MISPSKRARVIYVVSPAVFFVSHRMPLAKQAIAEGYEVSVITPEGEGVNKILAAGFDWHPMRFDPGGMNPVRDLTTFLDLVRTFRQIQPTIVHNVTLKPVLYGTLAARLTGVPRVINAISGLGYLFTGARTLRRLLGIMLYRSFMRHADMRVIVQNTDDLQLFHRHQLAPVETIRLIRGSGVDISAYTPASHPPAEPLVVQVSRMVGDKGVREFIEAATIVRRRFPEVRFMLVGPLYPGNPSALCEAELQEAEGTGAVTWLGARDDIAELLASASIFCLPSYREGLPKALLEAGASGLPSVTTDAPGCREVVQDGVNGFLVPVADATALADAIFRLLNDPAGAAEMGARARAIVERDFALGEILARQIALYKEPHKNARRMEVLKDRSS